MARAILLRVDMSIVVLSKNFVFAGLVLGISGKQLKSLISRITESGKSESPMETRWMLWISWGDDNWTELLIQVQVYNDAVPASLANTHILSREVLVIIMV